MKLKKAAALALAFTTAAALCVPATAFADAITVGTDGGTADSAITGTIKVTTISVSVPTAATFNVDPAHASAPNDTGQFESPTNYTITNSSVVPIYTYISKVAASGVKLTDAAGQVLPASTLGGLDAKIQFTVKDVAPTNFDTPTDWLTVGDNLHFYAFGATTDKGEIAVNDTKTMKFYGQAPSTNWTNNQSFTVTPTFTVSATEPA